MHTLYVPVLVALITGPLFVICDRVMAALSNRHRDRAETGLTLDQRWEKWANNLEDELTTLKNRVTDLETRLQVAQAREQDMRRLLRRIVSWALLMRDRLTEVGGDVPHMPDEVESALVYLDTQP